MPTCASRPRSPTTCPASSSTPPALERSSAVERRLDDLRGPSRFADQAGRAPGARRRARFRRASRAGSTRGRSRSRPARQGRADRLLDLHVHQLPAHAAVPARLGRALPRPRADDRRRPHARVRVREGHRQRQDAIARNDLRYAVAQDNDYGTWEAWGNQYWPAKYLIDAKGQVRYTALRRGRLRRDRGGDPVTAARGTDPAARRARGRQPRRGAGQAGDAGDLPRRGARRALDAAAEPGVHDYPGFQRLAGDQLRARRALEGRRRVSEAVRGATLRAHVTGKSRLPRARVARPRAADRRRAGRRQASRSHRRQRLDTLPAAHRGAHATLRFDRARVTRSRSRRTRSSAVAAFGRRSPRIECRASSSRRASRRSSRSGAIALLTCRS